MSFPRLPPILARELVAQTRTTRWVWLRIAFAAIPLWIVGVTLVASGDGSLAVLSPARVGPAMRLASRLIAGVFLVATLTTSGQAALAIAGEKDRRTLDFLLATRLGNAEIILSKLAACLISTFATLGAGLPVVLLLIPLGGIDPVLVAMSCVAAATLSLTVASIGILASTQARDGRRATASAVFFAMLWFIGPLVVAWVLPRFGLRLPWPLASANAALLAASPIGVLVKLAAGLPGSALVDVVLRMCGIQVAASAVMVILAIALLRSSYRVHTGGDGLLGRGRRLRRIAWRLRRRPDVGDDPIFWRERHTSKGGGVAQFLGVVIWVALAGGVAYGTYHFGRPALAEVWAHGYTSGPSPAERPEMNLFIRVFVPTADLPIDQARLDFNSYLRVISIGIALFLGILAMSFAFEGISVERAKETWPGLIGTPLSAREILASKFLAGLWRLRSALLTLAVLWTLGMAAGALHPLGVAVAALTVASWTSFLLVIGLVVAIRAKSSKSGGSPLMALVALLPWSILLPYVLPIGFRSVLLGAASLPFDVGLALVSFREVRVAARFAEYPPLHWFRLDSGEGRLAVAVTFAIGIIVPTVLGRLAWQYAIRHFDRLVGRPWRPRTG